MKKIERVWVVTGILILAMIDRTGAQYRLHEQAKKLMSMGGALRPAETTTTTTTTTPSTRGPRPGPPLKEDKTEDYAIEEMTPKQQFIREGHLYTETLVGHITINIMFKDLRTRVEVTEKAAKKIASARRSRVQDILPTWQATIDQLAEILNFFSVQREEVDTRQRPMSRTFADDPESIDLHNINALRRYVVGYKEKTTTTAAPQPRNVAGILGGVLGLYNTAEGKQTHHLAEANSKAIQKVMESVDALREYGEKNSQRLDTTMEELMQVNQLNSMTAVERYWDQTRDLITAAGQVAMGATQQRLDPAILAIVDMENIWQGFLLKISMDDWVPAFTRSQHLYQVKASFLGDTELVKIQVHIPMRQAAATRWELLRFIPRPVFQDGVMFTILPIQARLAVDPVTHAYMEIEEDTLGSCSEVPGALYCPDTVRVVHTDNSGSCLAAIWSEVWANIESTCWIQARRPTTTAWAEGPNRFVIIAPTTLTVHVDCPHRPARATMISGYKLVSLKSGCRLTTEMFTLHAGNETMDERFHVEVDTEGSSSMIRNATLNMATGERLAQLRHPMAVHSVAAEVTRILEEGRNWSLFGKKAWVAIILSAVALFLILAFILFLWCRIKLAHLSVAEVGQLARSKLRRTLSRRPRWRPSQRGRTDTRQDMEMAGRSANTTDAENSHAVDAIGQFDGNVDISDTEMDEVEHRVAALLLDTDPIVEITHQIDSLVIDQQPQVEEMEPMDDMFRNGPTTVWIEGKAVNVAISREYEHSYIATALYHKLRDWWPWAELPSLRVHYSYNDLMRWTEKATIGVKIEETRIGLPMYVTDDIEGDIEAILGRNFVLALKETFLRPGEYDCQGIPVREFLDILDPPTSDDEDVEAEQPQVTIWPDVTHGTGTEWEENSDDDDWEPPRKVRRPDTPRPRVEMDDEGTLRRPGLGRGRRPRWSRGWKSHWAAW